MITYNWDLAIRMVILFLLFNATASLGLGLLKCKKDEYSGKNEIMGGLVIIGLIILPVFF